ncbi:hypothetical protein PLICRDRAFT_49733 [Plicaturopsis crispa FD-325 SS-3]|nr:hypothetical protein PLICRDRAFT_49733 [Plicaturopsis crispa FD-325 SS-3]
MSAHARFIGAVKDDWQLYSDAPEDYTLGAPIGFGASSTVYAAHFHPPSQPKPTPCALKVLDLDSLPPHSLALLQRETQLMSLSKHPNVIRVRGTWMDGHKLYIAMRLMNKGSAADVMRYGWPGGMEEEVVRCILRQALEGLNYLHINGFIHRDVKAANLLIDDDGTVLLGDLGVAASLAEDSDHHHHSTAQPPALTHAHPLQSHALIHAPKKNRPKYGKRMSFVGTPCWMAPELIQGKQYDSSADIWSFGITALELSQGRPPRSRETPHAVLLQTVTDAAPTLDREGGTHKYSRAFQEIVSMCLEKDPTKRPKAQALLQMPFFRAAKKKSYLIPTILATLPPLTQRQERIRRSGIASVHRSIDSWDFSTTVGATAERSPTTSVRWRAKGRHVGEVFEMEGADGNVIAEDPLPEHEPGSPLARRQNDTRLPSGSESECSSPASVASPLLDEEADALTEMTPVSSVSDTAPHPPPASPPRESLTLLSKPKLSPIVTSPPSSQPTAKPFTIAKRGRPATATGLPSSYPPPSVSSTFVTPSPPKPHGLWQRIRRKSSYGNGAGHSTVLEEGKKSSFLSRTTSRTVELWSGGSGFRA